MLLVLEGWVDVDEVGVWGLVLFIFFDAFEVPIDSIIIVFEQLVVDPNVVVAGCIVRSDFRGLSIPLDSLLIFLFGATIDDSNLIKCSTVLGM